MDILDTIKNRTSYRGKYKDIPVPRTDLVKILEAGTSAPSGCNKQTSSFIAVDDINLLSELKALIEPPIEPHHIVRTSQKSPYGKLNEAKNCLRNSSGVSYVFSCIR